MKVKLIERSAAPEQTHELALNRSEFLIGRGTDCDLRLSNHEISRHHCILRVTADEVTLIDLGSSNGTYRNGQRVRSQVALRSGDEIAVGDYRFVIDLGDRGWVELGGAGEGNAQEATLKLRNQSSSEGKKA